MKKSTLLLCLGCVVPAFCLTGNVRAANFVYVGNSVANTIEAYSPNGTPSLFSSSGINGPYDLTFDGSGNLYVANLYDNTVTKFDSQGHATPFVTSGLLGPDGIVYAGNGSFFVSNDGNGTIMKVNSLGAASFFASVNSPYAVAFYGGNLYVATAADSIVKIDSQGNISPFANTGLSGCTGLAFDANGNLFAANRYNDTITRFDSLGNSSLFVSTGATSPTDLAFDSNGNLYVVGFQNTYDTIVEYDTNGNPTLFSDQGMAIPTSIAVVPEPSAWAFFAAGTAALIGVRRCRRARN